MLSSDPSARGTSSVAIDLNSTTQSLTLDPRTIAAFTKRWNEWIPWVRIWVQDLPDPYHWYTQLQAAHRQRLIDLVIHQHIEMRTIRRLKLDDPRPSNFEARGYELRRYLERKATSKKRAKHIPRRYRSQSLTAEGDSLANQ